MKPKLFGWITPRKVFIKTLCFEHFEEIGRNEELRKYIPNFDLMELELQNLVKEHLKPYKTCISFVKILLKDGTWRLNLLLEVCLVTDPRRISSSRKTNWMSSEKRGNHLKITSQKGVNIDYEYPFVRGVEKFGVLV